MGTRVNSLVVTKVVDGDTINVLLEGVQEKLRFTCIDTEESLPGSHKPVTQAGLLASAWLKSRLTLPDGTLAPVDIEFDTHEPLDVCLVKHRDNYGRLLVYVHSGGVNLSLALVREGYSPYFDKYGRSRSYHTAMARAEASAQGEGRIIWDPAVPNRGDYRALQQWWRARALAVEDYRRIGLDAGVMSVRVDYAALTCAAERGQAATVFCDMQGGVNKWTGGGALIYAGSVYHKFNLWMPNADTEGCAELLRLIEVRYADQGLGYVYVTGTLSVYGGRPQMVLTDAAQLSDFPPGV